MVKFWCKECNNLLSIDSLSKFYHQNYFLRPNADFRLCFARLWSLPLLFTSDPPSVKTHGLLGTEEYSIIFYTQLVTEIDRNYNAPVKLFCPPPPSGTPGDITIWGGVAPVFLSLYFSLALPYINAIITLFSSAPPMGGGMGAEQFDWCIKAVTLL